MQRGKREKRTVRQLPAFLPAIRISKSENNYACSSYTSREHIGCMPDKQKSSATHKLKAGLHHRADNITLR